MKAIKLKKANQKAAYNADKSRPRDGQTSSDTEGKLLKRKGKKRGVKPISNTIPILTRPTKIDKAAPLHLARLHKTSKTKQTKTEDTRKISRNLGTNKDITSKQDKHMTSTKRQQASNKDLRPSPNTKNTQFNTKNKINIANPRTMQKINTEFEKQAQNYHTLTAGWARCVSVPPT